MLRRDDPDVAPHIAKYVATINQSLVHRETETILQPMHQPKNGKLYRGGGMPHEFFGFFTAGKKYRVPGFLATSLNENVARKFMAMANQSRNEPCVLWIVNVDSKCLHASYIARTHAQTEEEFLFAPYSPFKVLRVSYAHLSFFPSSTCMSWSCFYMSGIGQGERNFSSSGKKFLLPQKSCISCIYPVVVRYSTVFYPSKNTS
jgi:hypothetical protein